MGQKESNTKKFLQFSEGPVEWIFFCPFPLTMITDRAKRYRKMWNSDKKKRSVHLNIVGKLHDEEAPFCPYASNERMTAFIIFFMHRNIKKNVNIKCKEVSQVN